MLAEKHAVNIDGTESKERLTNWSSYLCEVKHLQPKDLDTSADCRNHGGLFSSNKYLNKFNFYLPHNKPILETSFVNMFTFLHTFSSLPSICRFQQVKGILGSSVFGFNLKTAIFSPEHKYTQIYLFPFRINQFLYK